MQAVLHPLHNTLFTQKQVTVEVLRLDRIHPVISGNKWFKLKYHLQQAEQQQKKGIITFGGAWSNHLVATAFACHQAGMDAMGIIRGEQPSLLSDTLLNAQQYGMHLQFISRALYADESQIIAQLQAQYPHYYIVPQGGQSPWGVIGATEITDLVVLNNYSHIACAVGTGTMLAGIVRASLPNQQVIGVSSLKIPPGDNSHTSFVAPYANQKNYTIFYDYHFGGYARKTGALLAFMNDMYEKYQLPTDFVYTGKLLYGIHDLIQKDYFNRGSHLLLIHSGGLQGNRSLPAGTLTFL